MKTFGANENDLMAWHLNLEIFQARVSCRLATAAIFIDFQSTK